MAAVKNDGNALGHASDELKADKEWIIAAVKNDGYALDYASDELKADKEVVMAAVKNDGYALNYASDELKADKEVIMAADKKYGNVLDVNKKMNYEKLTADQANRVFYAFANALAEENETTAYSNIWGHFGLDLPDDGWHMDEGEGVELYQRIKDMYLENWNLLLLSFWMTDMETLEEVCETNDVFKWCKERLDELPDDFSEEQLEEVIIEIHESVWG